MVDLRNAVDGLVLTALVRDPRSRALATPETIARLRRDPSSLARMPNRPEAPPELANLFEAAVSDDGQIDRDESVQLRRAQSLLRMPTNHRSIAASFMRHSARPARYFYPHPNPAPVAPRQPEPAPRVTQQQCVPAAVVPAVPVTPRAPLPVLPTDQARASGTQVMDAVSERHPQANSTMLQQIPERFWEAVQRSDGTESNSEIAWRLMRELDQSAPDQATRDALPDAIKSLITNEGFTGETGEGPGHDGGNEKGPNSGEPVAEVRK